MNIKYSNLSNQKDSKEIGSYFYFSDEILSKDKKNIECMPKDYSFLSTCRSAIDVCLKQINVQHKIALLPSFTCHAVVEPFIENGYTVLPFAIKDNFEIDIEKLIKQLEEVKPSVILIHDYFGINTNSNLKSFSINKVLKKNGVCVIIDKTQSMFSTYQQINGDYYVGSIRKWLGIPDGAFISLRLSVEDEDEELSENKSKAMLYKNNYIKNNIGCKETLLKLYREAEQTLDSRTRPYKMSNVSQKILANTSFNKLVKTRRRNYELLSNGLSQCNIIKIPYSNLKDNEVPFYFPVFVQTKRAELQKYLADNNVYATVIWACPNEFLDLIDNESKKIYEEILCIPCDQRYTENDMKYIVELIMNFNEVTKHE